jgi:uncharacterized protein
VWANELGAIDDGHAPAGDHNGGSRSRSWGGSPRRSASGAAVTMQVQLDKRYEVAVPAAQAWTVLSDIRAVAGCMPGAQITEQVDERHYKGSVRAKVGPAAMTFAGDIEVKTLDAAERRLEMLGKGADRAGSSASMNLAAHLEAGTDARSSVLVGTATVTVSGKLAQFGGRLIVPVADAMLGQFADNFRAAAAAAGAVAATLPQQPIDGAPAAVAAAAAGAVAPVDTAKVDDAGLDAGAAVGRPPIARAPARDLDMLTLMWLVIKRRLAALFGRKS